MGKQLNNYVGAFGELEAVKYLKKSGYKILAKNCKFAGAELDIVAICPKKLQKKQLKKEYKNGTIKSKYAFKHLIEGVQNTLIFVEVKYSSTRVYGEPSERVDKEKQKQIIRASEIFMMKNKFDLPYRYDIISIVGKELTHIENAF